MNLEQPNRTRYYGLLCALVVGLCALLTRPFLEMGVSDDWSYIKTALDFANTGHMVYNGWATAMLGWQILWGALFIKLFGFSFTVLHLSTLPIAMVTIYLFHEILRGFRVSEKNAIFGTLTLGLSPLFVFSSVTFMSDIPGLFCIVLCLYCCQRALQSTSDVHAIVWLVIAGITNTIGGTVRQIAWLGVLVMVTCAGWLLRKRRGVLPATLLVWLLGLAGIYASMHWFQRQPYSLPEDLVQGAVNLKAVLHLLRQMSRLLFSLALFALPVLVAWLVPGPSRPRKKLAILSIGVLALAAFLFVLERHHDLDPYLAPWMGNIVSRHGIVDFNILLGARPAVLSTGFRIVLSLIVAAAMVAFLDYLVTRAPHKTSPDTNLQRVAWAEILTLVGPFTLAYFALLLPRAAFQNLFDRYLLGPLAIILLLLLLYFQEHVSSRLPVWSAIVLVVFAIFGIAGVHDMFTMDRARLAAAESIRATGVPRTSIQAGVEYDGWTQIVTDGYLNEPRLRVPKGAYHPPVHLSDEQHKCRYWFLDDTPAVHPDYVLVFTPQPCLAPSAFSPTPYRMWLPPFKGTIYVQQARK